jgi:hypothetical protein
MQKNLNSIIGRLVSHIYPFKFQTSIQKTYLKLDSQKESNYQVGSFILSVHNTHKSKGDLTYINGNLLQFYVSENMI